MFRVAAFTSTDLPNVTQFFRAYAASLPIDLGYQGFDAEFASLPGKYAPPQGALLIARDANGAALGCVAMRPLEDGICEMERLHVAPEGRGQGLGKQLALAIIEAAAPPATAKCASIRSPPCTTRKSSTVRSASPRSARTTTRRSKAPCS